MALTDEQIVKSVYRAMKQEGFSRRSLAKKMGWQLTTLRRRLGGGVPFTMGEVGEVAGALGLDWDEVLRFRGLYLIDDDPADQLTDIPVTHVARVFAAAIPVGDRAQMVPGEHPVDLNARIVS